jgi:putative ubiquitin-RnfH superfamily antitoxin RatB of RatAB toxin-antitoxin module
MADSEPALNIQVCYAGHGGIFLRDLRVPAGATVHQAIRQSGVMEVAPEIDLTVWRVGIYGQLKQLDTVLRAYDRIEIYRPLVADPKEARRKRATGSGRDKRAQR